MMDTGEKITLLQIRETVYSFLSTTFFNIPTKENIKLIIEQNLFKEFPLEIDREDFQRAMDLLISWAEESSTAEFHEVIHSLQQDYTSLFIGPGHLLAPPWESVYLTEEKLTFGEPTFKVREFYLQHGLQYVRKNSEPDDHFGLEMEFMSRLIAKQRECLDAGENKEAELLEHVQFSFLQEHTMKWLNEFTGNIMSQANSSYFQGLALLARSYLTWDYHQLQEVSIL